MAYKTGETAAVRYRSMGTIPTGNTLTGVSQETAFAETFTIPANSMNAGDALYIRVWGTVSSGGLVPTSRIRMKFNHGLSSVVQLADTGTVSQLINLASRPFQMELTCVIRTVGTSATMEVMGVFMYPGSTNMDTLDLSPIGLVTFNSTIDNIVGLTAVLGGVGLSSGTITLRQMIVRG